MLEDEISDFIWRRNQSDQVSDAKQRDDDQQGFGSFEVLLVVAVGVADVGTDFANHHLEQKIKIMDLLKTILEK